MKKLKHIVRKSDRQTHHKEGKLMRFLRSKTENHLLFAAFVVVMTSMVVINTIFILNYVPTVQQTAAPDDPNKILTSLQIAKTDAYEVKVSNVTENAKKDNAFTLAAGDTMLILDISITNISSGAQQLVPASQFYARDRKGGLYMLHPSSYVTNPLVLSTLQPGESITGQLSFAVPKVIAHPLLYVDLGWDNNAPTVIDVLK